MFFASKLLYYIILTRSTGCELSKSYSMIPDPYYINIQIGHSNNTVFLDIRLLCLSLTFRSFARATIPTASCWAFVYHFDMFLQIILKMGTEIALITKQILFLPCVSLQNVLWHQGGRQRTSIVPLVSSYYP